MIASIRSLANDNRTCIATIHQPSPKVFFLFDKLVLMAMGRIIYFGPTKNVVSYFASSSFQFNYVPGTNPAEYAIAIAGSHIPAHNGKIIQGSELASYFTTTEMAQDNRNEVENIVDNINNNTPPVQMIYRTSTFHQCNILCRRVLLKTRVHIKPVAVQIGKHVGVGLFFGSLYYGLGENEYQERLSLIFFSLMTLVLGHQQAIPLIFEDRLLFYREKVVGCYGAFPYWVSTLVINVPVVFINELLYSLLVYYMGGLSNEHGHFGVFFYNMLFASASSMFLCLAVAAASPDASTAMNVFSTIVYIIFFISGYVVYLPSLPLILKNWAPYLSFMRWAFQATVLNEFTVNDDLPNSEYYIDELGFDEYTRDQSSGILVVFLLFYAFAYLAALKYINWESR